MARLTTRSAAAALLTAALTVSLAPAYAAEDASRVLVAASEDGEVFDLDEYTGDADRSDITVTLSDLSGAPVASEPGEELRWFWTITPFDGSERRRVPSGPGAYEADSTPRDTATYDVVLPKEEGSGTYRLMAALAPTGSSDGFGPRTPRSARTPPVRRNCGSPTHRAWMASSTSPGKRTSGHG